LTGKPVTRAAISRVLLEPASRRVWAVNMYIMDTDSTCIH